MLSAGTTPNFCFKHSIYSDKVTELKLRSQSAGLKFQFRNGSSETLSNKSKDSENIKKISIHVPKHLKPVTDLEFANYLAGLIDGDGHFSKAFQLVIAFNELDASLAYFLKEKIGYGNVYRVKNKKALILVISKRKGLLKILNLINGKIRSENKLTQINKNILSNPYFKLMSNFTINPDLDLNNYWLAGFSDADASFQIKLITRNNKTEVRLNFQIDQKRNDLLILIKNFLGGNIGYRKSQDTYYYNSTSFGSAKNVIHYLDHYHLLSSKYLNYLKWRKVYILVQNKNHILPEGQDKIIRIKSTMNSNSQDELDL